MATPEQILATLESGEPARLIPVVADTSREQRITSTLLATFMVVPEYAFAMLEEAGGPTAKRAKISCYTEVVLKPKGATKGTRPDGLIIVTWGKKCWSALVEAKIGAAELNKEQVEDYLDLARATGIQAVITISNQFATLPSHHPIPVSKHKIRSVGLYHFSWLSLLAKAIVVAESQAVSDPEQSFLLSELVRHMEHSASGVISLGRMGTGWKEVCDSVQHGAPLKKTDPNVQEAVSDWHQLARFLAVELTSALGKPVQAALSRKQSQDPAALLNDDLAHLIKTNTLRTAFKIPNAAAAIDLWADLQRRTANIAMRLDAPKDKSRATAAINWLTRQLKSTEDQDLTVVAHWPRRTPTTMSSLAQAVADPTVLVPDGTKETPYALEVVKVVDLAGRFRGAKTFVEDLTAAVPRFYRDVGQNLNKWVPKPPRLRGEDGDADPPTRRTLPEAANQASGEQGGAPSSDEQTPSESDSSPGSIQTSRERQP